MQKRNCFHNILACLVLLSGLLPSCDDAQKEYSTYPCYVVIDNSVHLDATLASAMNSVSPGVFCMIRKVQKSGATYYTFSTNQGLSSESIVTAVDNRIGGVVGMNNGIIVGFGNLDSPAIFYAYDRECPNCFDSEAIPVKSKPLSMDNLGHATCSVCGRVYDMNNRGYIISGEQGNPLTRYPANTGGPYATLLVQ